MESFRNHPRLALRITQLAVFATLLGRGLFYLIWDAPLRAVLWDESTMSPIVANWGYTWSEWVTDMRVEQNIQLLIQVLGTLFILLSISTLVVHKWRKLANITLPLAAFLTLIHALLNTKAHFGQLGQLIELSLQWASPLLLLMLLKYPFTKQLDYAFRLAIALTFIGHGLYAVGYYPVPGNFQDMMMNSFGIDRQLAISLLKVAGILDFISAILLLLPYKKWAVGGMYYIIFWGLLTTFARLWSYIDWVSMDGLVLRWVPETILRWVHFLIPLALLFLWQKKLPLRGSHSDE